MTVNLTALAEARAKMTPGDLTHDEVMRGNDLVIDVVRTSDGNSIAVGTHGDDTDWNAGDAAGLVATHNAADILIDVTRAAKAFIDCDEDEGEMRYHELVDALSKVTL